MPPLLKQRASTIVLSGLVATVGITLDGRERHPQEDARSFLTGAFALTSDEIDRVDRGEVLTRTLGADDSRDVATFGLARLRITPDFYIAQFEDIGRFKRSDAVLAAGSFSRPPAAGDLAGLTLDDTDVKNLRDCRVGRCGVQLPAYAIEQFQREVDWRRDDAHDRADQVMRRFLVEYVGRYEQAGTSASVRYADQPIELDSNREFASAGGLGQGVWQRFPALARHVAEYPNNPAPDTTDRFYWSKERVGRRTVASVTHLAVARTAGDSPADYAIASKQIYGTHYFDASLGLTLLVRDRAAPESVLYLAYLNRSRIDMFGGMFGRLTRRVVIVRARATVAEQLTRLQRTLEPAFIASREH
jgi:hypothetical protein